MERIQKTRLLAPKIQKAFAFRPLIYLNGARQSGKSFLSKHMIAPAFKAKHLYTFDNITTREAAINAPRAFLNQEKPLFIDEVQLAPPLFRELKIAVDEARDQNQASSLFFLTGSTNLLALPTLSDALVGRMQCFTLYPFASSEIMNGKGDFIEQLKTKTRQNAEKRPLAEIITEATYPEISLWPQDQQKQWYKNYTMQLLDRDIHELADVKKRDAFLKLLQLLASHAGKTLNETQLARDIGLSLPTLKDYMRLLNYLFITFEIPAWSGEIGKRLVASSKRYFIDTGLLSYLLGTSLKEIQFTNPTLYNDIIENFIASEILKLISFSYEEPMLYFLRTHDQKEISFILEFDNKELILLNFTAQEQISSKDKSVKFIEDFKNRTQSTVKASYIIYLGPKEINITEEIKAIPMATLWS